MSKYLIVVYFFLHVFKFSSEFLNSFNHKNSDSYSNIFVKNEYLYLTGTNYVFRLSSKNISENALYKERLINTTNPILRNLNNHTKNFIKFMYWRERNNDIIICGTNIGKPHLYDLKASDLTNQLEYNGIFLCPGLENMNSLGLISFDLSINKIKRISNGIMYSAIWHTNEPDNINKIFSRYGIYRKEIETNKYLLKTINSPFWLWEPNFISMIEDDLYVYVFLTEYSIEEYANKFGINNTDRLTLSNLTIKSPQNLQRFSRLARVCKNDEGISNEKWKDIWSSFRKIRIKCNCNQKFFTKIQKYNSSFADSTSYQISFNNLIFLKQLNDEKLIAIFYQNFENLIDKNDSELTVLCEFDLIIIKNIMRNRKFWPSNSHNNKTDPLIDCNFVNENNFDLYENTILNEKYYGECKFFLPYKVNAFTIDATSGSKEKSVYFSDYNAQIINIIRDKNGFYHLENIYNLTDYYFKFSNDKQTDMIKLKSFKNINDIIVNQNSLYISTKSHVHQVDIINLINNSCNKYSECIECVKNKNCMWNNISCVRRPINYVRNNHKCIQFNKSNFEINSITKNQSVRLECNFERKYVKLNKQNSYNFSNEDIYFTNIFDKNYKMIVRNLIFKENIIYNCYNLNNFTKTYLMNFPTELKLVFKNINDSLIEFKLFINELKNFTNKLKEIKSFC